MTDEATDWRAEMAVQNEHLRGQLAALGRGPAARWRRFRLHEVVCGGCGETLVEVMDTEPYAVVLTREMQPSDEESALDPSAGPIERAKVSGQRLRRGERRWFPISKPPPPSDSKEARSGIVVSVCRCRQVTLPMAGIFDSLRRGSRKRVLPAANVSQ